MSSVPTEPFLFPEEAPRSGRERPKAPLTRDEAHEAINDLFRRAMKHGNAKQWMQGLLAFIAGMRRYSIFTAKLIYVQRPEAANHIESLAPTTALRALRADDQL